MKVPSPSLWEGQQLLFQTVIAGEGEVGLDWLSSEYFPFEYVASSVLLKGSSPSPASPTLPKGRVISSSLNGLVFNV